MAVRPSCDAVVSFGFLWLTLNVGNGWEWMGMIHDDLRGSSHRSIRLAPRMLEILFRGQDGRLSGVSPVSLKKSVDRWLQPMETSPPATTRREEIYDL